MKIKRIGIDSKLYAESLELRDKILRNPLGISISEEQIYNEKQENYFHFCLTINDELVSALSIRINSSYIQICQIATKDCFRNKGYGGKLLTYAENEISVMYDDKKFIVFSRLESLCFYKKLGYYFKNEKEYEIVGLKHRLMIKSCS